MNDHEEELLRAIPLRAPSSLLDERIEKLLAVERIERPRLLTRAVPAWQLAAACVACAVGAFLAGMLARSWNAAAPAPAQVRYVIQVDQKGFDVFDWTKYPKNSAPVSLLKAKHAAQETSGKI